MLHIKWSHIDISIDRSLKSGAIAQLYFNKSSNHNYLMIKSRLSNLSSFDAYMLRCSVSHVYKVSARYAQVVECIKKDNCLVSARHIRNSELIEIGWNNKCIRHVSIDKNDFIQFVLFIVHTFWSFWNAWGTVIDKIFMYAFCRSIIFFAAHVHRTANNIRTLKSLNIDSDERALNRSDCYYQIINTVKKQQHQFERIIQTTRELSDYIHHNYLHCEHRFNAFTRSLHAGVDMNANFVYCLFLFRSF